jgi:putative OPT family oligopeptide transporter
VHQVRFIGAGAIAVAAVWTLVKLAGPVVSGVVSTLRASRGKKGASDKRDVDMGVFWILLITVLCLVGIGFLLVQFLRGTPLEADTRTLVSFALPFIFFVGFLIAAVCGYMAGLIGASNSPISGVGILAILICTVLLLAVVQPAENMRPALVAFALFTTAVVFAIACISNNNLQDLKTGQLVGATPAAQQWALIIGCFAGAAVIPPVLDLLNQANGFPGGPPAIVANAKPLAAPQATLISALAEGVITQKMNWTMLLWGMGLGVVLIIIDEVMRVLKLVRLPPLAVGIGIYLPMSATLPVVAGAIIGYWYDRFAKRQRNPERSKRLAVLVASGMIVGESLFGVVLAGLVVSTQKDAPLNLAPANWPADTANWIGLATFAALIVLLYLWMIAKSRRMPAQAQK